MTQKTRDKLLSIFAGSLSGLVIFLLFTLIVSLEKEKRKNTYLSNLSDKVQTIKNTIEVEFSEKIYLTTALAAVVRTHPDISQNQFADFANQVLLNSEEPIRCIQLIKDSIISHVYPDKGNEEALGLNIYKHLNNNKILIESIENKKPNMSGPLKLIQGGLGFVYRIPIYVSDSASKKGAFWGFSAVVVDVDSLLNEIEALKDTSISFAIKTVKGFNSIPYFYGDSIVFVTDPVTKSIHIAGNEWEIAAIPNTGWCGVESMEFWVYFLGFFICISGGILVGGLFYSLFRLKQLNADLIVKNETIQNQIDEKGILIKEIHHRVKNHFQMVSSIARIQAYETKNPETSAVLKEMENRIRSFSMAHEQLYKSDSETTKLKQYIQALAQQLVDAKKDDVEITLEMEEIEIPFKVSIYLGIIINELITNSLKHAFKDDSTKNQIYLSIKIKEDQYQLQYSDNGVGIPKHTFEKNESSFGIELIKMMTEQLNGEIKQIDLNEFSGILLTWK